MKHRNFLVRGALLAVAWLCCPSLFAQVPIPSEGEILKTLRKEHPRLLVPAGEEARIKTLIAEDKAAAALFQRLIKAAEAEIAKEPVRYDLKIRSQSTLKPIPGTAQNRIVLLATLFRLTGEKKYLDRAVLELDTICRFPDWNHGCFLDTSLLTVGAAVGYDWLYHDLTPEQRTLIREAIRDKGLLPGKEAYEKKLGWTRSEFNWNQACAGGLSVGALAIADEEPELSARILNRTCTGIQKAMGEFAPDGGTREGPGYWSFAVQYNIYLLAALDGALGTDFGLSGLPGFADTGRFRIHFTTPVKTVFGYGDTSSSTGGAWPMQWLSRKFHRPDYARQDLSLFTPNTPLHLWWYSNEKSPSEEPTTALFKRAGLVFMRSSWEPDAVYVALKAGTNAAGHAHLELGHFQLIADERIWCDDLGSITQYTSDYFKRGSRWTYYQASNLSHNVPHVDSGLQNEKGVAPVTLFEVSSDKTVAEIDLTDAYKDRVDKASRRISLQGRIATVEDSFRGLRGETFTWQIHSPARSVLVDEKNPRRVNMQDRFKRMRMEILEPEDAVFELEEIVFPQGQKKPENRKRVVIRRKIDDRPIDVKVRFSPLPDATPKKERKP